MKSHKGKLYAHKKYLKIWEKKWNQFKKFARTHMPNFVNTWHAKMDIHIFRYIFIGLGFIIFFSFIIALMAGINRGAKVTTGTRADDNHSSAGMVSLTQESAGDGSSWLFKIKAEQKINSMYGYYVSLCNNVDENNVVNSESFPQKVNKLNNGNEVARAKNGNETETWESGHESRLFTLTQRERVGIKEAYIYTIDKDGDTITDIHEIRMRIDNGSGCNTDEEEEESQPEEPSDEDSEEPEDEEDTEEGGSPVEPEERSSESEDEPKCGPGYDASYWDGNEGHCVCVNTSKPEWKKLKDIAGEDVSDRRYCDNDVAVSQWEYVPQSPDDGDDDDDESPSDEGSEEPEDEVVRSASYEEVERICREEHSGLKYRGCYHDDSLYGYQSTAVLVCATHTEDECENADCADYGEEYHPLTTQLCPGDTPEDYEKIKEDETSGGGKIKCVQGAECTQQSCGESIAECDACGGKWCNGGKCQCN